MHGTVSTNLPWPAMVKHGLHMCLVHTKNEYTLRTLKSLIRSIQHAEKEFGNVQFELVITDTNSEEKDIVKMRQLLEVSNLNHRLLILER